MTTGQVSYLEPKFLISQNNLQVSLLLENIQEVNIAVFDIKGKSKIHQKSYATIPGYNIFNVNTGKLAEGIYYVRLNFEGKQIYKMIQIK